MSRKYKQRPRTGTETVCTERKCDLCGTAAATPALPGNWSSQHSHEVANTKVTMEHNGDCFPDGGSWEEVTIDICVKCFNEKLIPWVEGLGGKPSRERVYV